MEAPHYRLTHLLISIHVPAWGTTDRDSNRQEHNNYFNPRSSVGNDETAKCCADDAEHFNPRSRVGNDMIVMKRNLWQGEFQSTFPRGERQLENLLAGIRPRFQSTFPRGERRESSYGTSEKMRFQSTFPRRERRKPSTASFNRYIFQSTFPRRERPSPALLI